MTQIFVYFIAGLFLALLFVNLFFRWKVIKVYKKLVQNRVQFDAMDVFKSSRTMEPVYQKFPNQKNDIADFIRYIRFSVGIAILIVVLITLLGLVLHYNR